MDKDATPPSPSTAFLCTRLVRLKKQKPVWLGSFYRLSYFFEKPVPITYYRSRFFKLTDTYNILKVSAFFLKKRHLYYMCRFSLELVLIVT